MFQSYFIPQEGFLSGLSLSSDKVILNSEYEEILRFYGFDMTPFNTPTTTESITTTTENSFINSTTVKKEQDDYEELNAAVTGTDITLLDSTTIFQTTEQTISFSSIDTTTDVISEMPKITEMSTLSTQMVTESVTVTTPLSNTVDTTTEIAQNNLTTTTTLETTTFVDNTKQNKIRKRSLIDHILENSNNKHKTRPFDYNQNRGTNYLFLVNGHYETEGINYMIYNTILPFCYNRDINSLVLKFPLDNPEYYLLLILPVDSFGINKLVCDLNEITNLKDIISQMSPHYVQAVIPNFKLHGFTVLTSSLQKVSNNFYSFIQFFLKSKALNYSLYL